VVPIHSALHSFWWEVRGWSHLGSPVHGDLLCWFQDSLWVFSFYQFDFDVCGYDLSSLSWVSFILYEVHWASGMYQLRLCASEALSSNPSPTKKKKKILCQIREGFVHYSFT
jgi:hypothetical protein